MGLRNPLLVAVTALPASSKTIIYVREGSEIVIRYKKGLFLTPTEVLVDDVGTLLPE